MTSTFFSFRGKFYHLTDGVAMGSPVSSVVANLFMEAFEQRALSEAKKKGFAPRVWERYVDDVFALIKRLSAPRLLQLLNELDENIRFTCEEEENGRLPFLDVAVERFEGRLRTGVYRKKTHTNRVLSFASHHPISAKRGVVVSLFDRVESHFSQSDNEGKEQERALLFSALAANGYPKAFVASTLRQCEERRRRKANKQSPGEKAEPLSRPKSTVVVPYVEGLSGQICRVLRQVGIRAVSKAQPWQWQVCRGIKDRIPEEKMKGVVYKVKCNDCQESYVGETLRSMTVRLKEHERHTRFGRVDLSAIAEHARLKDHRIDWSGARIVEVERKWHARKVKEALIIARENPALNKDKGMELSLSWLNLMRVT